MTFSSVKQIIDDQNVGRVKSLAAGKCSHHPRTSWIKYIAIALLIISANAIASQAGGAFSDFLSDFMESIGLAVLYAIGWLIYTTYAIFHYFKRPCDFLVVTDSGVLIISGVNKVANRIEFRDVELIKYNEISSIKYFSHFWTSYLRINEGATYRQFKQSIWLRMFPVHGETSTGPLESSRTIAVSGIADLSNYNLAQIQATAFGLLGAFVLLQPVFFALLEQKLYDDVAADLATAPTEMASDDEMMVADDLEDRADAAAAAADAAADAVDNLVDQELVPVEVELCNYSAHTPAYFALAWPDPAGVATHGWYDMSTGKCETMTMRVGQYQGTPILVGYAESEDGAVWIKPGSDAEICVNVEENFHKIREPGDACGIDEQQKTFSILKLEYDAVFQVYKAAWHLRN